MVTYVKDLQASAIVLLQLRHVISVKWKLDGSLTVTKGWEVEKLDFHPVRQRRHRRVSGR